LGVLTPLLNSLLEGGDPRRTISKFSRLIHVPHVTGEDLSAAYRDHKGPGNIPKEEMWKFHTTLTDSPFDLDRIIQDHSESEVVKNLFATACYPEHGLPLLLYFAQNNEVDVENTLLANTNAGGDNVHRGMVLGLIVGAANDEIPSSLMQGLIAFEELQAEIDDFTEIALSGKGI
jgi:hypothetical protein